MQAYRVQVFSGSPLFSIQVIPVCLFVAHDQNYDAIFRSQCEEEKKKLTKGTLREVHVMQINFAFPTLHKSPDSPPLHHCSAFFF